MLWNNIIKRRILTLILIVAILAILYTDHCVKAHQSKSQEDLMLSEYNNTQESTKSVEAIVISLEYVVKEYDRTVSELKMETRELIDYGEKIREIHEAEQYRKLWFRDIPLEEEYQIYLYETCLEMNLNYDLQLAKISLESNFDVNAINKSNSNGSVDYGLSQVNSCHLRTAKKLGLDVINNIEDNIWFGCKVFKDIKVDLRRQGYRGKELTIRSLNTYNFGAVGYKKYIARGNRYDSWKYARLVMSRLEEIR